MKRHEREAWEELVENVKKSGLAVVDPRRDVIIAVDAELKNLREAIEWVCDPERIKRYTFAAFSAEVRRRVQGIIPAVILKRFEPLDTCHDCGTSPGRPHINGCDVERCSVCGDQRFSCDKSKCYEHDKNFARWTGIFPGKAEADFLGLSLNEFEVLKLNRVFFKKPGIIRK